MRTTIEIDDTLMAEAMALSGLATEEETLNRALSDFVTNLARRKALDELWGMGWDGDLDAMREGRLPSLPPGAGFSEMLNTSSRDWPS